MDTILVIDESTEFLDDVEALLSDNYTVKKAVTGRRGLEYAHAGGVAAVLLDLRLPDMHGSEVLHSLQHEIDPNLPVIIVADQIDTETAVESMRLGASDFVSKTSIQDVLPTRLSRALARRSSESAPAMLHDGFAECHGRLVFASDPMKRVHFEISRLANTNFDVLLVGETGVGKDLCAYEIHRRSNRRDKPFVPLALRALSESLIESELFGHEKGAFSGAEKAKPGKLEAANGGTLYIPEVFSLTETVQLKLLQFMQYKSIARVGQDSRRPETKLDVRVILATNENPEEAVRNGRMRKDFYHRISGVRLEIPPLRERPEDIPLLAEFFLDRHSRSLSDHKIAFMPDVIAALGSYSWPGNVRELENAIKRALTFAQDGKLSREDFPLLSGRSADAAPCSGCLAQREGSPLSYRAAQEQFKRAYIENLLRRAGGSIPRAAGWAGLTGPGLRKLIKELGIHIGGTPPA